MVTTIFKSNSRIKSYARTPRGLERVSNLCANAKITKEFVHIKKFPIKKDDFIFFGSDSIPDKEK